jgi:putative nucleotidyltransferase with HDIG domain
MVMNQIPSTLASSASRDKKRLLLVDDELHILSVLNSLLSDQYDCRLANSAREALDCLRQGSYDLVLSDIMMPGMSGIELLASLKQLLPDAVVIMISGNLNIESAIEAMRLGAFDYITKPFNLADVEMAVERGLRFNELIEANHQYEHHLEELVSLRTHELRVTNTHLNNTVEKLYQNYRATLRGLASALEARDVETRGHSDRVVAFCIRLGQHLGLSDYDMIALECGALLHDVGKIGVPDAILYKPGALTDEEWVQMRRHVEYGSAILRNIEFLKDAAKVVEQHHEKFDGSGYLTGIAGEEIYIGARIFAVADAVDAFTSDRPYRAGRSFEEAVEELQRCAGAHFDPKIVQAFTDIPLNEWREIRRVVSEQGDQLRYNNLGKDIFYSAVVDEQRKERR